MGGVLSLDTVCLVWCLWFGKMMLELVLRYAWKNGMFLPNINKFVGLPEVFGKWRKVCARTKWVVLNGKWVLVSNGTEVFSNNVHI